MRALNTANLLIVDDNKRILDSLKFLLEDEVASISCVRNPNLLIDEIKRKEIDLVLLDMNFSAGKNTGNEGLYWLKEIKKIDKHIGVVLITAYSNVDLAVKAMKEGATDFIEKPWENNRVLATLQSAYSLRISFKEIEELKIKQRILNKSNTNQEIIWGESKAMKEISTSIQKISNTDVNVLILGENGTGKEVIARELHSQSNRKDEVFLKVDLGSLSESLFESELFGYMKGAFTDAKEDRTGKIAAAKGGTLFLDEIGNLSFNLQNKLLTVLQNKEITPLGSNKSFEVDFRLLCATNMNLKEMISNNQFREDLFYRINTITFNAPALRDRPEDLEELLLHFLKKYSHRYNKPSLNYSQKALAKLKQYSWPGNIRELKHSIEKAVILSESSVLNVDNFNFDNLEPKETNYKEAMSMDEIEKIAIIKAIKNNNGNLSHTAKELKIGRQTLYNKIQKYDI